jgi:hypothetical protein
VHDDGELPMTTIQMIGAAMVVLTIAPLLGGEVRGRR